MSGERSRVGCLFGSFNPVHNGHLIIAEFMATRTDLSHVIFIVSPQNPHKVVSGLEDDQHRLNMTRLAVTGNTHFEVNSIEFEMPRPSYTIDTLKRLSGAYPDKEFVPVIGSDNLSNIHTWKSGEELLEQFGCYVYLRPGSRPGLNADHPNVRLFDAPLINISATYIRSLVDEGLSIRYLVPDAVAQYINDHKLYK